MENTFNSIQYAKWATKEETDALFDYFKKKNKLKDSFTNYWLSENGNEFLKLHSTFYNDYSIALSNEYQYKYDKKVREYNNLLKSNCTCKGNLQVVKYDTYEFIGCENYREYGFDHVRVYKPKMFPFNEPEISTNYLFKLKTLYNLPAELKESILYEYLLITNTKPLLDLSSKYKIATDAKSKSKKREAIIKDILAMKFKKVYHQKAIKIKTDKERIKIPDFICFTDNTCYVIEQKKTIENISDEQLNLYISALQWMANKANTNIVVKGYYILEEGEYDLNNNILTLDTLTTYEFN
jgi:hypothetical protein